MLTDAYSIGKWSVYIALNMYNERYIGCTTNFTKTEKQLVKGNYIRKLFPTDYKDNHFSIRHKIFVRTFIEAHKFKRWIEMQEEPEKRFNLASVDRFKIEIMPTIQDDSRERQVKRQFNLTI